MQLLYLLRGDPLILVLVLQRVGSVSLQSHTNLTHCCVHSVTWSSLIGRDGPFSVFLHSFHISIICMLEKMNAGRKRLSQDLSTSAWRSGRKGRLVQADWLCPDKKNAHPNGCEWTDAVFTAEGQRRAESTRTHLYTQQLHPAHLGAKPSLRSLPDQTMWAITHSDIIGYCRPMFRLIVTQTQIS